MHCACGWGIRYKYAIKHYVNFTDQLVFIDETHKGELSSRRQKHWNKINGPQPYYEEFFGSHGIRYTFLAAVDYRGFIVEASDVVVRESGINDTDPCRGTIGAARFELWVKNELAPTLGRYVEDKPRSIFVLDNATIHHLERVKTIIESTGAKVIYTALYLLDLNPIEYFYGSYKNVFEKNHHDSWEEAHMKGINSVSPKEAMIFFRYCGLPVKKEI